MTSKAWLSLGANIGQPLVQLEEAITRLAEQVTIVARSSTIITKAWGMTDQPDFYNLALEIETEFTPLQLLDFCQSIEQDMGRVRREVWGPRLIDLDIIAYERLDMTSARLTLPHHYAHQREFVLVPLREIAPEVADWILLR